MEPESASVSREQQRSRESLSTAMSSFPSSTSRSPSISRLQTESVSVHPQNQPTAASSRTFLPVPLPLSPSSSPATSPSASPSPAMALVEHPSALQMPVGHINLNLNLKHAVNVNALTTDTRFLSVSALCTPPQSPFSGSRSLPGFRNPSPSPIRSANQAFIDVQSFGRVQTFTQPYQYQSKTFDFDATGGRGGRGEGGRGVEFEFDSALGGRGLGSMLDVEDVVYPRTASSNFSSGRTQFELFRSSQSRVIRVSDIFAFEACFLRFLGRERA